MGDEEKAEKLQVTGSQQLMSSYGSLDDATDGLFSAITDFRRPYFSMYTDVAYSMGSADCESILKQLHKMERVLIVTVLNCKLGPPEDVNGEIEETLRNGGGVKSGHKIIGTVDSRAW